MTTYSEKWRAGHERGFLPDVRRVRSDRNGAVGKRQDELSLRGSGQPFKLICKCCGEEFESMRSNTLFCGPNCRAKFYRQEAAERRERDCVCENCGKAFTTTRNDVKYCCEACQRKAHSKMRYRQKRAEEQSAEIV